MKQLSFLPKSNFKHQREHGGSLTLGRRRKRRPLSTKTSLHLVLRSDFAFGSRSLLRHRPLINRVIRKAQRRFHIRVYEQGIVSNHIHLLVKGENRKALQNFFRVVAGHIAQEILREFPILKHEKSQAGGAPTNKKFSPLRDVRKAVVAGAKTRERENKFWQTRIYSRLVTWGRDYVNTKKYVIQNAMEGWGIIPFKARKSPSAAVNRAKPKNRIASQESVKLKHGNSS